MKWIIRIPFAAFISLVAPLVFVIYWSLSDFTVKEAAKHVGDDLKGFWGIK